MPDAGELIALAERCEASTGPDRVLDAAIAFAVGAYDNKLRYGLDDCHIVRGERRGDKWLEVRVVGPNGGTLIYDEPYECCTASLDAAMTLVPKGWGWLVSKPNEKAMASGLLKERTPVMGEVQYGYDKHFTVAAATPALALCAAALRARTSQSGDA